MNNRNARNIKVAFDAGRTDTLKRLGISAALEKKAFLGGLAVRGLAALGRGLGSWGAKALTKAVPKATESAFHLGSGYAAGIPAAATRSAGQQFMGWSGKHLGSAGEAFGAASKGMAENPWGTLGRGGLEFGKGALMMGGKGIGGAAGKGTFAAGMGHTMLGGPGAPPPMPMQQAGQGFTNPYMMG
jgi:hypothetical protein